MTVQVKMFAAAKDEIGQTVVAIELPEGATVAQLRQALIDRFPSLGPLLQRAMFAVDRCYADEAARLGPDDEIACIPPVSGG